MKKILQLILYSLILAACSNDNDSNTQIDNPDTHLNELYIYVDNQSSISGTYHISHNGNNNQVGLPVPIGGTVYKIVNADFITLVDFRSTEASIMSAKLNHSTIDDFQLDANSCYELTFTTDADGEAILDKLTKVDCN